MLTVSELIYCKNLIAITIERKAYTQEEINHVKSFQLRILKILQPYFLTARICSAVVVVNSLRTSIKITNSVKNIQRITRGFLVRKKSKIEI